MWHAYLQELPSHHNSTFQNVIALDRLLTTRVPSVLTSREEIRVRVTDVKSGGSDTILCETSEALQRALASDDEGLRIISIYSSDSITPLKISPRLLANLLQRYHVHPSFLQVLLSFGSNVNVSEAGKSNLYVGGDEKNSYITYQINYVEEKKHQKHLTWSWRHTGVYHHHSRAQRGKAFDLFILLHPNDASVLERRIHNELQIARSMLVGLSGDSGHNNYISTALHSLALSSFSGNWQWYLRDLGRQFEKHNDLALTAVPEEATPLESYDMVSSLRDLNDSVLRAQVCCRGNLELVEKLKAATASGTLTTADDALKQIVMEYDAMGTELHGYLASCDELIPRIRNAIDLAGYTLSLHNQLDTAKIDRELRDLIGHLDMLQRDSVDDSAAVKIITFVSAVYLPGSFIVSLYGMNFFVFDTDARQIVIAHDFWIFIATWLPLTLATGLIYVLIVWFDAWWKRKPFRLFQRPVRATRVETDLGPQIITKG
ncbi:hypothetical protein ASPACDRAFT_34041 [Aspergillus aculeatus ATCC 16872]|uniref:CorA-like transporter domain-containing protein n=1 Tax=Aspergillus aculeatus (strain ATCC 16872 / CBS 172.66 / WB 5094) TaxID=690307 RepID=A0A1L9WLG8_ASPA1|nr:uncharacterized protein ASPACDRAFT_34041 [Aspergillus aculeatus ATCC 16872]OJJ97015.1 hypothetical protein ASPACDRAFT_34041 [Aspergillus aculeatus ATCC 16872]